MKSFLEFFEDRNDIILEYRHKNVFGFIKDSPHVNNKKGGNITRDPLTRKIPWNKGPYQKIRKQGDVLIGGELEKELSSMGGVEFKDGKEIKRKNSNQILKLFTNLHGQKCGKILEINESVQSVILTRNLADKIATNLIESGINRKGTIRMTAEICGVPETAVKKVKAYLLKDAKYHNDPEGSMLRNADMIMKGWDDEMIGIGTVFKGIIPDDIAKGEELYRKSINESSDYRGQHQAPTKEDAPAYDLSKIYPEDIYSSDAVRYYGHWGDSRDNEAINVIKYLRNKPNKMVKIYRAVPKIRDTEEVKEAKEKIKSLMRMASNSPHFYDDPYFKEQIERYKKIIPQDDKIGINKGDWVTTVKSYAIDHGRSALRGNYKIISKTVRAKDIYTNGDSIFEWGYDPD
jgi:hypothetical protein